jgi:hypothetical protein
MTAVITITAETAETAKTAEKRWRCAFRAFCVVRGAFIAYLPDFSAGRF